MKKVFKFILFAVLAVILAVGLYVAYVFLSNDRIEDNQSLEVVHGNSVSAAPVGESIDVVSYNIGFGAYLQDFTFFMDGGKESRADSRESVENNMAEICDQLDEMDADIYMIEEVDTPSTRSRKVDEKSIISEADFSGDFDKTYAVNYHSPYLMYPITEPHGQNNSGILTLSRFSINDSLRRSVPIQSGFGSIFDLDRCYSINRVATENGRELVVFSLHLSAYTSDPTIVDQQLAQLYEDMMKEYQAGNYVLAGGDFNKDLIGNSGDVFGISGDDYSWAKPFKEENLPEGLNLVKPYDAENPVATSRNADKPWDPETNFQVIIDGFIVSDNIKVEEVGVADYDFKCSDHNPVCLKMKLVN